MQIITLTNGYETQVDDADYPRLTAHHWYGLVQRRQVYAAWSVWNRATKDYDLLLMHRIIMDAQTGQLVDHIDRNPLNNQRDNLRICTRAQNAMNRTGRQGVTSQFKGVFLWEGSWRAQIKADGKIVKLGSFSSEHDAACAYNDAALHYFGSFAYLNLV